MGVSTCYWLSRLGAETLLVERHHLGAGASGRNAGIATIGPIDEYRTAIRKVGREAARAITALTVENRLLLSEILSMEGIQADYRESGFLSLACSEQELKLLNDSSELLRRDGFEAWELNRRECAERLGMRLGERFVGGAWSPGDGGLDPEAYLHGLARAASSRGARFLLGTRVLGLHRQGKIWKVETSRGAICADQVVLATNEETPYFLPELRNALRTSASQVVLTEPADARMAVAWAANGAIEYGRQDALGRIVIGGLEERHRGRLVAPVSDLGMGRAQQRLRQYVRISFPDLVGLRLIKKWIGVMSLVGDNIPLVGPWPGSPGLWLLTGFGGQGIPFSQVVPAGLAHALATGSQEKIPEYCSPVRLWEWSPGLCRTRPGGRRRLEAMS